MYPTNMTLADSGLFTGDPATGVAGGTTTSADQILVWNGVSYDTYYYQTSGLGGTGWRKAGFPTADASADVIPVGSSLILKRKTVNGFNWIVPQHPTNL
jgi:hypothetical protein